MSRATSYRTISVRFVLLCFGLSAVGSPVVAQGRLAVSVAGGPSSYDLSGTGTGGAGAAFLAWRPVRGLVVEPGLTVFGYRSQFGENTILLLPELSVQGELVLGSFRPFLGGGAGGAFSVSGVQTRTVTLHAVGGARVDLSENWGLLGEMRIRAVHPWTGHTVDFLFGASRALRPLTGRERDVPRVPALFPPSRLELSGHLGVHVDRHAEADRAIIDGTHSMYATSGEASAWSGRLGYWLRPRLGLQLDVSHSSNASWEGSTSFPVPGFANRTTYVSARGAIRTSPVRQFNLYAAAGPALMLYGGTGENLRTRDADLGAVLDVGARLRVTPRFGVELLLSNYFYRSRYRDEGTVFRHDFLILPGLVVSWPGGK